MIGCVLEVLNQILLLEVWFWVFVWWFDHEILLFNVWKSCLWWFWSGCWCCWKTWHSSHENHDFWCLFDVYLMAEKFLFGLIKIGFKSISEKIEKLVENQAEIWWTFGKKMFLVFGRTWKRVFKEFWGQNSIIKKFGVKN